MLRLIGISFLICCLALSCLYAEKDRVWPLQDRLVDMPTAGGFGKGVYDAYLLAYPDGGVLVGVGVGLNDIFSIGLSYRATGIIGSKDPKWGEWPEVYVKAVLIPEKGYQPAIALAYDSNGFDVLGQGGYTGNKHYPNNFYGVLSKSFLFLGGNAIHGGLCYCLQEGNKGITPSLGYEKEIEAFFFSTEYHFATNEDKKEGKDGYWNMEFGILLSPAATLKIELRDLLKDDGKPWNRSLNIGYRGKFK